MALRRPRRPACGVSALPRRRRRIPRASRPRPRARGRPRWGAGYGKAYFQSCAATAKRLGHAEVGERDLQSIGEAVSGSASRGGVVSRDTPEADLRSPGPDPDSRHRARIHAADLGVHGAGNAGRGRRDMYSPPGRSRRLGATRGTLPSAQELTLETGGSTGDTDPQWRLRVIVVHPRRRPMAPIDRSKGAAGR
jgi:hypothetical protein